MCGILCSDSYLFRKPPLTFELATTQFQVWSLQRSISTTGGAASLRARWNSHAKGPAHSWNICHSSVSLTHGPKPAQGQLLSKGPTLVSMSCPGNKELLSSQGSLSWSGLLCTPRMKHRQVWPHCVTDTWRRCPAGDPAQEWCTWFTKGILPESSPGAQQCQAVFSEHCYLILIIS